MLRQEVPLDHLLEIAQLPRATFYYHLKKMRQPDKHEVAKAEITAIYHENKGRYGYRRITAELRNRNLPLNHKTVQRLMKELGLVCRVRMKKYRSYKGEVGKIAPNLLNRDFTAEKPNQKWVTDVTEFSLFGEKLYLSPILDLYSSDLVSYTPHRCGDLAQHDGFREQLLHQGPHGRGGGPPADPGLDRQGGRQAPQCGDRGR
jgi:transposase InsO family protein